MFTHRWKKRSAVLVVGLAAFAAVPAVSSTESEVWAETSIGSGGEYFPVTPIRLLDTRDPNNDTGAPGAKPSDQDGETFSLKVTGRGGVPESNVLAVAVNIVAVQPASQGRLTVRPGGADTSTPTSLVNFRDTANAVANLGIVGVGNGGTIDIDLTTPLVAADMHVVVDLYGWIATSDYDDTADAGTRFRALTPYRLTDTRASTQLPQAMSSPRQINPGESIQLPIRGVGSVPNGDSVTGVVVNLSGVRPTGPTYLSLTPEQPAGDVTTATGNYATGEARGNLGIVPLGADGSIWVTAGPRPIDVVVDVLGYLETGASEESNSGRMVPLETPFRSFDTRGLEFGNVRLGQSQWEDWSFTKFSESVELAGVTNIPQEGFLGNLSGFSLQRATSTFMTLNPREIEAFTSPPENASLNLQNQGVVNSMLLAKYGSDGQDDAMVSVFNKAGSIHYTLDIFAIVLAD